MDRSLSEQGLLEAPSYSSLAAVSGGTSVTSVSSSTAPISTAGPVGTAVVHMAADQPLPQQHPPMMQLQPQSLGQQPQSLGQQPQFTLYQQQQQQQIHQAEAVPATGAAFAPGRGGLLDPLSAQHRDPVLPGRSLL